MMRFLLALAIAWGSFGFGNTLDCKSSDLEMTWVPYQANPGFSELVFEGEKTASLFDGLGPASANQYAFVLRTSACQFLTGGVVCQAPPHGVTNVEIDGEKKTVRNFQMVLSYSGSPVFMQVTLTLANAPVPIFKTYDFPDHGCEIH